MSPLLRLNHVLPTQRQRRRIRYENARRVAETRLYFTERLAAFIRWRWIRFHSGVIADQIESSCVTSRVIKWPALFWWAEWGWMRLPWGLRSVRWRTAASLGGREQPLGSETLCRPPRAAVMRLQRSRGQICVRRNEMLWELTLLIYMEKLNLLFQEQDNIFEHMST